MGMYHVGCKGELWGKVGITPTAHAHIRDAPVDKSKTTKPIAAAQQTDSDSALWSSDHTLFLGEYTHKVDEKGRLALPAKFRAQLSSGAILTRGTDKSLYLYSTEHWKPLAEKLAALPPFSSKAARALQRAVLGGATAVTPDRQGRILLPPSLREFADMGVGTTEVAVVGLYSRIEIWPAERWKQGSRETDLDEISEDLSKLGI